MTPQRIMQMTLVTILWSAALIATSEASLVGVAQAPHDPTQPIDYRLIFQTDHAWSPRTNINADTVMVYGIDETTASRIASWRQHGYHVTVMTGVAWGRYAPYLRGDFDGKQHWDETQQEKSGKLILHGGREVPYVAPSVAYGSYLAHGVEAALDAGAESVYLEEPEFWARAGWSDSFKHEWQEYYHEPWQAPDSSPDAQYRASKLKYFLYRRALAQVFGAVKKYGEARGRLIPCYVATHSLINYAQWDIVSPESSLLNVGADGYVAQVWTGTAREPNLYDGELKQRTFETAFLEYGALDNIARSSGKPIWYLNDPIEDNPRHSWSDYRANWESTLVASLLQPAVSRYEVLPWPDRIFGLTSRRPSVEPTADNPHPVEAVIPKAYETELQTVFHALGEMQQPASTMRWESAGTQNIGVLVSDTLMFQRAEPMKSDEHLSHFYGLALPLLMRGLPVQPVQIETSYRGSTATGSLAGNKILLLSYDGQKPPSPAFHTALAAWVKAGGVLLVLDDDKDPYNQARDWWNSGENRFSTPREHLFKVLGIPSGAIGLHTVGKGHVLFEPQSPATLAASPTGSKAVYALLQRGAEVSHVPLSGSASLILRRGPYVIAAGLNPGANEATTSSLAQSAVRGDLIDLFDPDLAEKSQVDVRPGTRALLLDIDRIRSSEPRVLAASAKISNGSTARDSFSFTAEGIDQTNAVMRVLVERPPRKVLLDGADLDSHQYERSGRTLLLKFTNKAIPQRIQIFF